MSYYNTCVVCKDRWKTAPAYRLKLDNVDYDNLEEFGQLYCVCEDCSQSGGCESVDYDRFLRREEQ